MFPATDILSAMHADLNNHLLNIQYIFSLRGSLFYESNESMSHESRVNVSGLFFNKVGYFILNNHLPVFK